MKIKSVVNTSVQDEGKKKETTRTELEGKREKKGEEEKEGESIIVKHPETRVDSETEIKSGEKITIETTESRIKRRREYGDDRDNEGKEERDERGKIKILKLDTSSELREKGDKQRRGVVIRQINTGKSRSGVRQVIGNITSRNGSINIVQSSRGSGTTQVIANLNSDEDIECTQE